jgi:3-phenylpropionate/trans-cinnamate dioxygenase ferredoxin reductase subunit
VPFDSHHLVVRGSIKDGKFAIFHLDEEGAILAVEAVNAPQEFMAGRMLVAEHRIVPEARLADTSIPMKEILKG